MTKLVYSIFLISLIVACSTPVENELRTTIVTKENAKDNQSITENKQPVSIKIEYERFQPNQIHGIEITNYQIETTHSFDSINIVIAYSDGDLESSAAPTSWGDRLIMMEGDSILFESKPVGDPYQYEPFFYRNSENNKVIIICQLGDEENYGGEAFLLQNRTIEFIGKIEVESPYETEYNTNLIEIIRVSELENTLYFNFESDSLINLKTEDRIKVKNDSIIYKYEHNNFELIGL